MRLPVQQYGGLVIKIWKKYYHCLWPIIVGHNLIDDWRQEACLIALQLKEAFGDIDGALPKEALNQINRGWYIFLKSNGLRKEKGTGRFVQQFTTYPILDDKDGIEIDNI
jgi:hypothetical protein